MLLIFALSSTSNPPGGGGGDTSAYAAHFTEYTILGTLVARAIGIGMPGLGIVVIAVAAAAFSASYGLSDEWHQSFVASRDASIIDAGFDAMGAVLGASLWAAATKMRRGSLSSRSR